MTGQNLFVAAVFAGTSVAIMLGALRSKKDVFPIALIAGSWIAISSALLIDRMRLNDLGGLFVVAMWLIVTYLLHTLGELSLSPVGLSAMTKLAPARVASLMMGVWFLGASVGNFIGGRLASFYETWPLFNLFAAVAAFGIGAGLVMLALAGPIKRLMGEVH